MSRYRFLLSLLCFLCFLPFGTAQFYHGSKVTFGQNRIQKKTFLWSYYRTPLADIYYYPKSKAWANVAALHMESYCKELQAKTGALMEHKIQVIVFADSGDYIQSNIGIDNNSFFEQDGWTLTEAQKIILYSREDTTDFLEHLRSGIAQLLVNQCVQQKNGIQRILLKENLPIWFKEGLCAYWGGAWKTDMEEQVRNGMLDKSYLTLEKQNRNEQLVGGISFWRYLSATYGEECLKSVLADVRKDYNVPRALEYVSGKDYALLQKEWLRFYLNHDTENILLPQAQEINILGDSIAQELPVPRLYETTYQWNRIVAAVNFDYFDIDYQQFVNAEHPIYINPGINLTLLTTSRDFMEDHRLTLGCRTSVRLEGISVHLNDQLEYLFSYEDLSRRIDRQLIVYYQSIGDALYSNFYQKQQTASVFYKFGFPLDQMRAFHLTPYARYNITHTAALDLPSLKMPTAYALWFGLKGDLVFDYTENIRVNLRKGFRGKIFSETLYHPLHDTRFLVVAGMDFRHYQPLHHSLVWVNRWAMSASYGKNRLVYYLGGVDNWVHALFNSNNPIDTSISYSYQALATNLRGFHQNVRNGSKFFVWNSELRFPFMQYLFHRPLHSNILNSLQVVGFADVGTAWNGFTPYDKSSFFFARQMKLKSFKEYTSPWVAGFGLGLHACILNYFIRLDYGFGLEGGRFNKGVLYLSLNSDF